MQSFGFTALTQPLPGLGELGGNALAFSYLLFEAMRQVAEFNLCTCLQHRLMRKERPNRSDEKDIAGSDSDVALVASHLPEQREESEIAGGIDDSGDNGLTGVVAEGNG